MLSLIFRWSPERIEYDRLTREQQEVVDEIRCKIYLFSGLAAAAIIGIVVGLKALLSV